MLYEDNKTLNKKKENDKDIEIEDQGQIIISEPFNPKDINIKTVPYTIGQIIDRLTYNEIELDTEFQRLPDLWKARNKSRLIESILLKLPIPAFYFDGQNDDKWEVVDGLQRISALKSFIIDGQMKLVNLEFLEELENCTFEKLPREFQRRIMTFPVTIYVIEQGTPLNVKYNLFKRINQGGLELTPQEIRHAIHQGKASALVKDLVDKKTSYGKSFIKATDGRVKPQRMEDRDFATRFVSFYLIPYQEYKPDLDTFLNKGLSLVKDLDDSVLIKIKNDFQKSMKLAFDIFGRDAFRKRYFNSDARFPINKAIFEVVSVTFAKLSDEDYKKLNMEKDLVKEKWIEMHRNPENKFDHAVSHSTASKENVETRFRLFNTMLKEVLQ